MKPSRLTQISKDLSDDPEAYWKPSIVKELIKYIEELQSENESLQSEVDELNEKLEGR